MTIRTQDQEEGIKALLKSIQKKRKPNRKNTYADIIYLALQELEEKIR